MKKWPLLLVIPLLPTIAFSQTVSEIPDPNLTPGVVKTTNQDEVCGIVNGLTYTKRHRVWTKQLSTSLKYHIPYTPKTYQDDDLIPVCLGGDNSDPKNHWPQPSHALTKFGFQEKDQLDDTACYRVCHTKDMTLEFAQSLFLNSDWRKSYCQIFPQELICK
jgi:hypothetical protein